MTVFVKAVSPIYITAMVLAFPMPPTAVDAAQLCDRDFALQTLSSGNLETFCACETISTALIRAVQRSDDFADVLSITSNKCPAIETILSEVTTASVSDTTERGDGGDGFQEPPESVGAELDNGW